MDNNFLTKFEKKHTKLHVCCRIHVKCDMTHLNILQGVIQIRAFLNPPCSVWRTGIFNNKYFLKAGRLTCVHMMHTTGHSQNFCLPQELACQLGRWDKNTSIHAGNYAEKPEHISLSLWMGVTEIERDESQLLLVFIRWQTAIIPLSVSRLSSSHSSVRAFRSNNYHSIPQWCWGKKKN